MQHRTLLTLVTIASLSATSAHSSESGEEWSALGFAFAHHFSSQGQVVKPASSTQKCGEQTDGLGNTFTSTVPIPGAVNAPGSKPGAYVYYRQPMYRCDEVVVPAERRGWQGNNPAIGLEYTRRYSDHSDLALATLVRDSYGTPSLMVAGGRLWPVGQLATVRFDAGLVGGLWYRSVLNRASDGVVRRLVPYALPSMTVSDRYSGLGLKLAFAPKATLNGYVVNRTPTVMVQTKYLVHESKRGLTAFTLGSGGSSRGVTASVDVAY